MVVLFYSIRLREYCGSRLIPPFSASFNIVLVENKTFKQIEL